MEITECHTLKECSVVPDLTGNSGKNGTSWLGRGHTVFALE